MELTIVDTFSGHAWPYVCSCVDTIATLTATAASIVDGFAENIDLVAYGESPTQMEET